MLALSSNAIVKQNDFTTLNSRLSRVAAESFIPDEYIKEILVRSWEQTLANFLNDSVLTREEETQLMQFASHFGLDQQALNRNGAFEKAAKGAILRELTEGKIPDRVSVSGQLPFNFQKNEKLVWAFPGAKFFEEKTIRSYAGRTSGVSIRLAKGVYYRTGGFTSTPVDSVHMVHQDTGMAGFTTKHVYFAGTRKSFRVPYNKIVAFTPFSDGIGFQKEGATAKPQGLMTGDGWFTFNLASNLAQFQNED